MPSREHFQNKLRDVGYRFKKGKGSKHTTAWVRHTHYVFVPKKNQLPDAWVRVTLRKCGVSEEDIDEFIRSSNA